MCITRNKSPTRDDHFFAYQKNLIKCRRLDPNSPDGRTPNNVVWCELCERRASGSHKISRKRNFRYFPSFCEISLCFIRFYFPSPTPKAVTCSRNIHKDSWMLKIDSYSNDVKSINFYCLLRSGHDEPCCAAKVFSMFLHVASGKTSSSLKMFSLSGQKQYAHRKFNVHRLLSSRIHQFCDNLRTVCKVLCGTSFMSELLQGFKS